MNLRLLRNKMKYRFEYRGKRRATLISIPEYIPHLDSPLPPISCHERKDMKTPRTTLSIIGFFLAGAWIIAWLFYGLLITEANHLRLLSFFGQ